MKSTVPTDGRTDAIERASRFAPFLRDGLLAFPDIADRFATDGPDAAVAQALKLEGASVGEALRHQRRALALSVALGDLSGELSLERLTGALSDFAEIIPPLARNDPGPRPYANPELTP